MPSSKGCGGQSPLPGVSGCPLRECVDTTAKKQSRLAPPSLVVESKPLLLQRDAKRKGVRRDYTFRPKVQSNQTSWHLAGFKYT